jgi:hypothetical protein
LVLNTPLLHNIRFTLRRSSGLAYEKPQSAHSAFVGFFSGTFWAGVNASHCHITCPKRRIAFTLGEMPIEIFVKY